MCLLCYAANNLSAWGLKADQISIPTSNKHTDGPDLFLFSAALKF